MQPRPKSSIVVTTRDAAKLRALLKEQGDWHDATLVRCLDVALAYAVVVAPHQIAPDVVTMNSHVLYHDPRSTGSTEARLVYSNGGDDDQRVPVLSPLGIALLGARVGQTAMWSSPNRRVRRLRVTALPYQPERAGDFHL
jgi:regulator of nucleoside diphosphate kinase